MALELPVAMTVLVLGLPLTRSRRTVWRTSSIAIARPSMRPRTRIAWPLAPTIHGAVVKQTTSASRDARINVTVKFVNGPDGANPNMRMNS
jgi:hypothetical protein